MVEVYCKMKVYVIRRGIDRNLWKKCEEEPKQVAYCGYLEVDDPFNKGLWNLCNWSCWTNKKPKECKNLLITHCNNDTAFLVEGKWYNDYMESFENFEECYKALTGDTINPYFDALWPLNYGFEDRNSIQVVTPENINDIIK